MVCVGCTQSGPLAVPPGAATWLRRATARRVRSGAEWLVQRVSRSRAVSTELALIAALYLAYSGVRVLARADQSTALAHARSLVHLETLTGLHVEAPINHLVTGVPVLAVVASYWYAALHYTVTPTVLVLLWRRDRERYRTARTALALGSAMGLVGFLLVPTAPPRMLDGFADTLTTTARYGWWSEHASAPRGLAGLTNEYAAMPSLHVGWALWVAWVAWTVGRGSAIRVAGTVYAAGTALVVVATGNHYLIDVLAGAAVVAVAIAVATRVDRRRRRREMLAPPAAAVDRPDGREAAGEVDESGAVGARVPAGV